MSPDDAPNLTFPPMLDGFSGIVQQLPIGRPAYLTRLNLTCQPLHASRAAVLCDPLRMLPALTSLELWIHMPDLRVAQEAYFSELFTPVPGLEDLHFLCTTEFGKVSDLNFETSTVRAALLPIRFKFSSTPSLST
jgi:hypothetical protein